MDIDYVFTYVDGNDPAWSSEMIKHARKHKKLLDGNSSRFRDWKTLPYLFRGIANNMPWIRNVYMVVERESQVPSWVNRETVNII